MKQWNVNDLRYWPGVDEGYLAFKAARAMNAPFQRRDSIPHLLSLLYCED